MCFNKFVVSIDIFVSHIRLVSDDYKTSTTTYTFFDAKKLISINRVIHAHTVHMIRLTNTTSKTMWWSCQLNPPNNGHAQFTQVYPWSNTAL